MFPKDPPVINEELIRAMKLVITWCEWPGCRAHGFMDPAHIRARGQGGGRRKDTFENILMLCRTHHDLYDHQLGQSRERQASLQQIALSRAAWVRAQVFAMVES